MAKTRVYKKQSETGGRMAFIFCPGCKANHAFQLDVPQENGSMWTWNGSVDKPSFQPSMLVWQNEPEARCHSFVTDGKIQFLGDCFHDLKNQTIDLPDFD